MLGSITSEPGSMARHSGCPGLENQGWWVKRVCLPPVNSGEQRKECGPCLTLSLSPTPHRPWWGGWKFAKRPTHDRTWIVHACRQFLYVHYGMWQHHWYIKNLASSRMTRLVHSLSLIITVGNSYAHVIDWLYRDWWPIHCELRTSASGSQVEEYWLSSETGSKSPGEDRN